MNILVVAEHRQGKWNNTSFETLAAAQQIAKDTSGTISGLVIGKTVADMLFPDGNVIGQVIRIKNVPFVVVGELEAKGYSFGGSDQDDCVVVPYSSAMKRLFGATNIRGIRPQRRNALTLARWVCSLPAPPAT